MALTKCSHCGKEISTRARICVHCGAPGEKPILLKDEVPVASSGRVSAKRILYGVVLGIGLLLGIPALFVWVGSLLLPPETERQIEESAIKTGISRPSTISSAGGQWYSGGTLHRSKVAQWNKATYQNKLATSADWALASPKVKNQVMKSGSMDILRSFVEKLLTCVNETAAGKGYEGMATSELAASCMILMGWR